MAKVEEQILRNKTNMGRKFDDKWLKVQKNAPKEREKLRRLAKDVNY